MKYIDLHCDTLTLTTMMTTVNPLRQNDKSSVDLERLQKAHCMAQFFAIFLPSQEVFQDLGREPKADEDYIEELFLHYQSSLRKNDDLLASALSCEDIRRHDSLKKISAILTMEDGRVIDSVEKLKHYYDLGFRQVGLLWNHENGLGYPNSTEKSVMNKGLKKLGFEVLEEMNRLGMIIDVSHLSDGGFWDVVKHSKQPFIASHSNARSLSPHPRNLSDEMLKALAESGGVAGLNVCPFFLNRDIQDPKSRITVMAEHLDHMVQKGGQDLVALGMDFDGIHGDLELDSCHKLPLLFEFLHARGWSDEAIEKLAWKNAFRVIAEVLR